MAKEIQTYLNYEKKGIDYKIKYKDNSKRTCPYYLSADSCAVDDFVQSDEIKSIASMYPLNNVTAERVEDIVGSCNRSVLGSGERTVGLIQDVETANNLREKLGKDRIVVIIPRGDYIKRHRPKTKESVVGFVISPREEFIKRIKNIVFYSWEKIFIGSWNVMFLIDDQKDKGTLSHELAHTLGQGKEFYRQFEKQKPNSNLPLKPLPDKDQTQCRKFNGSTEEVCYRYRIQLGLHTGTKNGKSFWKFVGNRYSIMNNEGNFYNINPSRALWIDRDTFQKTFKALSERKGGVATEDEDFLDKESRKQKVQITFSGFYDINTKKVIMSDLEISKMKMNIASTLPDNLVPFMDVQLQDETNNMVLDQKREAMLPLEMKAINQDGTDQKLFTFSSFVVGFDNKKEYKNKKLRIVAKDSNTSQWTFYKSFLVDELPNTLEK